MLIFFSKGEVFLEILTISSGFNDLGIFSKVDSFNFVNSEDVLINENLINKRRETNKTVI